MAEGLLTGTIGDQASTLAVETPAAVAVTGRPGSRELSRTGHTRWIKFCHWIMALSVLTLAFSGFFILMAHPRLYWGAVGNDLTPALIELPIRFETTGTGDGDRAYRSSRMRAPRSAPFVPLTF